MNRVLTKILILSLLIIPIHSMAYNDEPDTLRAALYVKINNTFYKGDSIPNVTLHEYYCMAPKQFKNDKQRKEYDRLVRNVKYVFPYAQLVRTTLIETYDYLQTLPNKKAKEKHLTAVEKGVKEQYTPVVKKMTRTQGRLLVKLIDRECGQTSYDMVKAFLGPVKAGFYQVFAGLFGNSLTKHYRPETDEQDKEIERIIKMLESGQL